MPENEFDKKVSSELQQLRFKPSDAVWMKVEERIQKKKKRRVFMIIFLLAGIALLGYWQWDKFFGGSKGDIVKTETPVSENETAVNSEKDNTNNENKIDNKSQEVRVDTENERINLKETPETINSTDKTSISVSEKNIQEQKIIGKKKNNKPVISDKRIQGNGNKNLKPVQRNVVALTDTDLPIVTKDGPVIAKDSSGKSTTVDNIIQDTAQKAIMTNNKIDTVKVDTLVSKADTKKDTVSKKIDSVLKTVSIDSPVVSIPKKPLDKKWSFGIDFNPGFSTFNGSFFSFSMNKSFDVGGQAPPPGSGSSASPASPSRRLAGFAFQLGGVAERKLSKRSSVSIGLRYAYYSDNMEIGARRLNVSNNLSLFLDRQGAAQAFGAAGDTNHVTNSYQFIEVPLSYTLRLNKSESHPATLQLGLKIGHMVGSNALVYDTVENGIYYRSKKYLNKNQFGFSASVYWTIISKEKFQLKVGPVTDIHFNSLLNSPFEENRYLLFTGIRTFLKFRSKK